MSTTPVGCPILLSSDKISKTAPSHLCLNIQQLSNYFGFWSIKNWNFLLEVCQPNFSFIQGGDTPMELGHVAIIYKAQSNKSPIDCPRDFLDVVHCDIGYGDTKSVGNGASHCIILVDQASHYLSIKFLTP